MHCSTLQLHTAAPCIRYGHIVQVAAVLAEAEGAEERLLERACHRRRVRSRHLCVAKAVHLQGPACPDVGQQVCSRCLVTVYGIWVSFDWGGLWYGWSPLKVCAIYVSSPGTRAHTYGWAMRMGLFAFIFWEKKVVVG